jgi:hypothetical protein
MSDRNKKNLLYFESQSMRELYEIMEKWQQTNSKRLLSTDIQNDNDKFCCIALSNPSEVVICNGSGRDQATVEHGHVGIVIYSGGILAESQYSAEVGPGGSLSVHD